MLDGAADETESGGTRGARGGKRRERVSGRQDPAPSTTPTAHENSERHSIVARTDYRPEPHNTTVSSRDAFDPSAPHDVCFQARLPLCVVAAADAARVRLGLASGAHRRKDQIATENEHYDTGASIKPQRPAETLKPLGCFAWRGPYHEQRKTVSGAVGEQQERQKSTLPLNAATYKIAASPGSPQGLMTSGSHVETPSASAAAAPPVSREAAVAHPGALPISRSRSLASARRPRWSAASKTVCTSKATFGYLG